MSPRQTGVTLCRRPGFGISESPTYVARGVAALAQADDVDRWAGTIVSARQLADAYDFTDTDGSRPDCWGHIAAYGWEHEDGRGIDEFRRSQPVARRAGQEQGRQDLNLQPPVLETGALPIELRPSVALRMYRRLSAI